MRLCFEAMPGTQDKDKTRSAARGEAMAVTGERSFGTDYTAAERFCDEWAGDTQSHVAVVEDFSIGGPASSDEGVFFVMDYDRAAEYVKGHDAEIAYDADHRPDAYWR